MTRRPLALLVLAGALVGALATRWWGFVDLRVYRYGGQTVLDGLPLYAAAEPHTGLLFTYPPFAALAMAPLAAGPSWLASGLVAAVGVLALAATLRAFGVPARWLGVVVAPMLVLDLVRETLEFGQVNLVLMALVAWDLLVLRGRWSGLLVGLAAGIKLTPLVFVAFLVLTGRRAEALRAVSAFTATLLVGVVALPRDAAAYWTEALLDTGRIGHTEYVRNQSLNGTLTRLLHHEPAPVLWFAACAVAGGALLLAGAAWWRRGEREVAVLLAAGAVLLCSPISWDHHFVWFAPALVVLARRAPWPAAGVAAFVLAGPRALVEHGGGAELGWHPVQQVAGNGYAWLVLGLGALAAAALVRSRQLEREQRALVVVGDPRRARPAGPVVGAGAGDHAAEPGLGRGLEPAVVHGDAARPAVLGGAGDPLGGEVGPLALGVARGDEQRHRGAGDAGGEGLAHLDGAGPLADAVDAPLVPAVDLEPCDQGAHRRDSRTARRHLGRRPGRRPRRR